MSGTLDAAPHYGVARPGDEIAELLADECSSQLQMSEGRQAHRRQRKETERLRVGEQGTRGATRIVERGRGEAGGGGTRRITVHFSFVFPLFVGGQRAVAST